MLETFSIAKLPTDVGGARDGPVRPTLGHEPFITHEAGREVAMPVAKAEQKPTECIRSPL